jgi:hypothetical protein
VSPLRRSGVHFEIVISQQRDPHGPTNPRVRVERLEAAIGVVEVDYRHLPKDVGSRSTDGTNKIQRTGIAELANMDERYNEEHLKRVKEWLGIVTQYLGCRLDPSGGVVPLVLMDVRMYYT